jgi:aspartyl-tRNA(Asn)/glutamyl-tRNA(Gln) amidotransferase subunit A
VTLFSLTSCELQEKLSKREISSREVVSRYLERIESCDAHIRAFITIAAERALKAADKADEMRSRKSDRCTAITGIPIALKDNICVKDLPCSCGSKILKDFRAPYNATVVEKLENDGAVILGKTNMDEFAMGSSTENSAFFTTRNPWNSARVPGGSSGGSAAAVAAREVPWALGSDTGGSVRQPAAFCGITGLKPTYGLISRYGLVAYASSLDQIGVLARDVKDCALLLHHCAGHDTRDSTSAAACVPDYGALLSKKHGGVRLGIPAEFFTESLEPAVGRVIKSALEKFRECGFQTVEVSLPHIRYSLPAYYIIAPAEASSNLARYDGARYGYRDNEAPDILSMFKNSRRAGFGAEVKRRIMLGTYTLSSGYYDAYYLKAQKVRTLIKRDFDECFRDCDCLVGPTTPTTAFAIGENVDDPLKMYLMDIYTVSVNLAGLPGLVIPCGFADNLPVGLQLIGKPFDEATLLSIGHAFQQATEFHSAEPPVLFKAGM